MDPIFAPTAHTDYLLIYTVSWDPTRKCSTSVHIEPGVSLDEAIREVARTTTAQTGKSRWIVCDDATLIRPEDVVAVQVLPAAVVTTLDQPSQPFGFTIGPDE